MIFIIWHDYDGYSIDEFDEDDNDFSPVLVEERLGEILRRKESDDYGVILDAIIQGEKLNYKTIKVTEIAKIEGI